MEKIDRQDQLSVYTQLTLRISDFDLLLDETVKFVSDSMNVDCYVLIEQQSEDDNLLLRSGGCWTSNAQDPEQIMAGIDSQADYTLQVKRPVIAKDLSSEHRFKGAAILKHMGMKSSLSVVVPGKESAFGVLAVYTRRPSNFSHREANHLQSVANILASAILRIRSETGLYLSRDQLGVILEGTADGILVQDKNHRLRFCNQVAASILGFDSPEELINTSMTELLQNYAILDDTGKPYDFDRLPSRQVLEGKTDVSEVIRYRERGGNQERWAMIKSRPVINAEGEVVMAVSVFHDITQLKVEEKAQFFLAEVGKILASSLDYSVTLNSVAHLATSQLADWCAVDVLEDDNTVHRLVVVHNDPEKADWARELFKRYPVDLDTPSGVSKVLKSGHAEFYPEISEQLLQNFNVEAEVLSFFDHVHLRSAMIMPLIARGQTFGALTLAWAESKSKYNETDLILAEELARRASVAIDNARLYRQSQSLNEELEGRVAKRTEQLHSLIATLRNEISERESTEDELQRSETILSAIFEAAPDGHVLVDPNGNIVRVNAQVEALFGYERQELVGKPVEFLLPVEYRTRHILHRLSYMTNPNFRTMGAGLEMTAKRKDGSEFLVDVLLNPVNTEHETLLIAAIRDITERKQMEAELAEVQRRLIENVEAERLSLAQDLHDGPIQDLYGISYSLSALDQNLNGALDDNDSQETLVTSIKMTQHVIDYLRSISGELRPPALAPFGLEKAIRAHSETIQQSQPDLELDLDLEPDGQRLPERTRLALYRIYQTAVRNVIRHASASCLSVRLQIDDAQVELAVEDDGCGFELPLHFVELARSGHFGLVGIYERVKALGGELKIRTAPGEGTLIQVNLPVNRDDE